MHCTYITFEMDSFEFVTFIGEKKLITQKRDRRDLTYLTQQQLDIVDIRCRFNELNRNKQET